MPDPNHDDHVQWLMHQYALTKEAAEAEAQDRYVKYPQERARWGVDRATSVERYNMLINHARTPGHTLMFRRMNDTTNGFEQYEVFCNCGWWDDWDEPKVVPA